jgi:basic amino acid/polyamine antiporter, APA family
LVKVASAALIFTYIFSCVCVLILRESRLQNYQPRFKSPFYPWIQIAGIVGFGFLLFEMGKETLFSAIIFVVISLAVYWFYGRIRTNREYALLHLVERVMAKELTTHSLETELKDIIRERDDITKDKFDKVIEKSIVLDIEKHISVEDLFKRISEAVTEYLGVSKDLIYNKMLEREKESTCAISPTIAIPHIIVEGDHKFTIVLIRCREGITFSEEKTDIRTVFALIGSRDERNFHLRALSAIAQISQDPYFEKKWDNAKSVEVLRDVVLLGERRRY